MNHSEVYKQMGFTEPNLIENYIIYYISFTQAGVLSAVSILFFKQLLYIYLGSPFHNSYKIKNLETYFPCKTTNNKDKQVIIQFLFLG